MAFEFIDTALKQRRNDGLLRQRNNVESAIGALIEVDGKPFLNFSSNDYLGMRQSTEVLQAWVDGICQYGGGSGASALVTGYSKTHKQLEDYLAESLQREAVILFNSGFAANQAICQALLSANHQVIADKLIHASFIDGARSSKAKLRRFRHNDVSHLAQLLAGTNEETLVATEGVFSMDGDQAPIKEILENINPQSTWLMLDDAHGFGVLGATGLGTIEACSLNQQQIPILMGTFGKAIGTAGAFIAGSENLINYLVNFARHYIYSTAMPPAQANATLASLMSIKSNGKRDKLHSNITLFKKLAAETGISLMPSESAIQPIIIGDPVKASSISNQLKSLGIWVNAIRSPTVPKHTDRLRITLTASHSEKDIHALVDALQLCILPVVMSTTRE